MNGKIARETTKKLLLYNIPILLLYMVFKTVFILGERLIVKMHSYVFGAVGLISIVLFALGIAAVTISLYKVFIEDLLSGKSYKYFSLPYKKSEIIFAKAVPAIIIESIMAILLFDTDFIEHPIETLFWKEGNVVVFYKEEVAQCVIDVSLRFIAFLLFGIMIGMLILLAVVISRSFDLSKSGRNFVLAVIIEVLANAALYTVISNIENEMDNKWRSAIQAIPELAAKEIYTSKELYSSIGLIAYWSEIISVIVLVIVIIEIVCPIIITKKLADKRFNVL